VAGALLAGPDGGVGGGGGGGPGHLPLLLQGRRGHHHGQDSVRGGLLALFFVLNNINIR
jgi:hypothetical protein